MIGVIEWPQISSEAVMATNKTPIKIELTRDEREILEQVSRAFAVAHRDVVRAQTILLPADGMSLSAVGRKVGLASRAGALAVRPVHAPARRARARALRR